MPAAFVTSITRCFSLVGRLKTLQEEAFQVGIALSADHLRSHSDSSVISNISQAGTADIIRRPRLWANNKDMKTDTYSDRFSTKCRNDYTMSSKWTGNKSGNRLQHDGNSCLKSGVGGRQQNEVSHRGTTSHSHAYVHHTNLIRSGDQSGDSIRKWRDSYSKTCLSSLNPRARPKLPPVQVFKRANHTLYTWTSEKAYSSIKKQNICSYIWLTKKW